eukprot:g3152.t1
MYTKTKMSFCMGSSLASAAADDRGYRYAAVRLYSDEHFASLEQALGFPLPQDQPLSLETLQRDIAAAAEDVPLPHVKIQPLEDVLKKQVGLPAHLLHEGLNAFKQELTRRDDHDPPERLLSFGEERKQALQQLLRDMRRVARKKARRGVYAVRLAAKRQRELDSVWTKDSLPLPTPLRGAVDKNRAEGAGNVDAGARAGSAGKGKKAPASKKGSVGDHGIAPSSAVPEDVKCMIECCACVAQMHDAHLADIFEMLHLLLAGLDGLAPPIDASPAQMRVFFEKALGGKEELQRCGELGAAKAGAVEGEAAAEAVVDARTRVFNLFLARQAQDAHAVVKDMVVSATKEQEDEEITPEVSEKKNIFDVLVPESPRANKMSYPIKAQCLIAPKGKPCGGGEEEAPGCTGIVTFVQESAEKCVISWDLKNCGKAGKHGFHIHEKADFSNGCMSAGPHYNPFATKDQEDEGITPEAGEEQAVEPVEHEVDPKAQEDAKAQDDAKSQEQNEENKQGEKVENVDAPQPTPASVA